MTSSAAGYIPVGSELHTTLQRLAALHLDATVLCLYLDLDPAQFDHPRWVEHQIDEHLEHVAKEVDAHRAPGAASTSSPAERPEIAPRFESMLSAATRERLAGRFTVAVGGTSADEIRRAALLCFEAEERGREVCQGRTAENAARLSVTVAS